MSIFHAAVIKPKAVVAAVKAAECRNKPGVIAFAAGAGVALMGSFLMLFRDSSKDAGKREVIEEMQAKHEGKAL